MAKITQQSSSSDLLKQSGTDKEQCSVEDPLYENLGGFNHESRDRELFFKRICPCTLYNSVSILGHLRFSTAFDIQLTAEQ
jgi:hypothetical protein